MLPIIWKRRNSIEGTPFDEFVDKFFYGRSPVDTNSETIWNPRVDVNETDHEVLLDVEIPGIDKKDIKVEVKNNTLSISGERKQETKTENEGFSRIERRYGKFERSFGIPDTVIPDSVTAKYKDGILSLTLTKTETIRRLRLYTVSEPTVINTYTITVYGISMNYMIYRMTPMK